LRKYSHSDDNIASRITGYENNKMRIQFAVNKYNLIGTFEVKDFLEEEDMKFDVIITNPPYQKGDNKRWKLWVQFILKSIELTTDNGFVSLITPFSWVNATKSSSPEIYKATDIIKKNNLLYLEKLPKNTFGVSETIGCFLFQKSPPTIESVNLLNSHKSMSNIIVDKVSGNNYNFINYNSTLYDNNEEGDILCYHTSANRFKIKSSDKFVNQAKYKVIINRSGYYDVDVFDSNTIAGRNASALMYETKEQSEIAKANLTLKLFKFAINATKTSGWNLLQTLPCIDLSIKWSDNELYDHFDLTHEERIYIEANVK
jgi:hypothetical protein